LIQRSLSVAYETGLIFLGLIRLYLYSENSIHFSCMHVCLQFALSGPENHPYKRCINTNNTAAMAESVVM
jgi:hypothetical protein